MNNILVLSSGTRNKVIEYFKNELTNDDNSRSGYVVATDMNSLAPSLYEADKHYIVPRIDDPGYLDCVLNICKKENIQAVFSLIDPELGLLAKNKKLFDDLGIKIIGSSAEACDICLDKFEMYHWLRSHGYLCAKTYNNLNDFQKDYENGNIKFPVFAKPRKGSASIQISKVEDMEELEFLFKRHQDLIVQELLDGQEIGVDAYIDIISNKPVSIFLKKKLAMKAGETEKSVSFKDKVLFNLMEKFINEFGFSGEIDVDIFDVEGQYFISEVNPRFGGGYPHCQEAGCNHCKLIVNNLKGIENESSIGLYDDGIYMSKYNDVLIMRGQV